MEASVAVLCLGPLFGTVFGTTDTPEKQEEQEIGMLIFKDRDVSDLW